MRSSLFKGSLPPVFCQRACKRLGLSLLDCLITLSNSSCALRCCHSWREGERLLTVQLESGTTTVWPISPPVSFSGSSPRSGSMGTAHAPSCYLCQGAYHNSIICSVTRLCPSCLLSKGVCISIVLHLASCKTVTCMLPHVLCARGCMTAISFTWRLT